MDLDLWNAFPSLEWDAIREAVTADLPALLPWSLWCQQATTEVRLPAGEWISCDRGAEQGDPLGPLFCAVVLRRAAKRARDAVASAGFWVWESWYMDDGQVAVPAAAAGIYAEAFDAALQEYGGTRVASGEFKSTARLCGSPEARAAAGAWAEPLRESFRLLQERPADKVLGIGIDGADVRRQLQTAIRKVQETCAALRAVDDPSVELTLLRLCASSCKVVHLLRGAGLAISDSDLTEFDDVTETALGNILGGEITGTAAARAALGVRDGGLGLRKARDLRLPAFVASRVESRPLAAEMASGLPEAVLHRVLERWDQETTAAIAQWRRELPPGTAAVAQQTIEHAQRIAERHAWELLGEIPSAPAGGAQPGDLTLAGLLGRPGSEDVEHPDREPNLQTKLADLGAGALIADIIGELEAAEDWPGLRQFDDLRAAGTDHTWLWALSNADGSEVRPREFCTAVRLRLGADIISTEAVCACCGGQLDRRCFHALRCAPGESTRGHIWVASTLVDASSLSDPSTVAEPRGLVGSRPGLRPADLLSSAAFGRPAALDVSIVCPDASGAAADPCAATAARKVDKYGHVLEELREEGIDYRPLVWTCWGRPSGDAQQAMRTIAAAAARRRGLGDPAPLERHLRGSVGAQIWRRAACMVHACLPDAATEDVSRLIRPRGDGAWGGPPGTAPDEGLWLGAQRASVAATAAVGASGAARAAPASSCRLPSGPYFS